MTAIRFTTHALSIRKRFRLDTEQVYEYNQSKAILVLVCLMLVNEYKPEFYVRKKRTLHHLYCNKLFFPSECLYCR